MSRTESSVRIDAEGRIQLPPEVREELGLEAGQQVELTTEDGTLVVRTAREGEDTSESGSEDADTEALIERIDRLTAEAVANRERRVASEASAPGQDRSDDIHARRHRRAIERRAEQAAETEERTERERERTE